MLALLYIGAVLVFVGAIWLLVVAFKTHILWGLGCLLIYPVCLVFVVLHWKVASKPFLVQVAGCALALVAATNTSIHLS
jgi:hypothetical protein